MAISFTLVADSHPAKNYDQISDTLQDIRAGLTSVTTNGNLYRPISALRTLVLLHKNHYHLYSAEREVADTPVSFRTPSSSKHGE